MNLRLQPVQIATGSDDAESQLVFADGFLVAVLVQLSDQHGDDADKWFIEAAFSSIDAMHAPLFIDLDEAKTWISDEIFSTLQEIDDAASTPARPRLSYK